VHRCTAAANVIIVHRRQVVMHERIAVNALDRGGGVEGRGLRHAEQRRRLDDEKGP